MKKWVIGFFSLHIALVGNLASAKIQDLQVNSAEFFAQELEGQGQPEGLPCDGVLTSDYGVRSLRKRHSRMHEGVDIAAPVGTPIAAPAAGKVLFAGNKAGYGRTVILEHADGFTTLFAHNSKLLVSEGQEVARGETISLLGNSGRSTGPHLHYEIRRFDQAVDPTPFL